MFAVIMESLGERNVEGRNNEALQSSLRFELGCMLEQVPKNSAD